jgi:hypothetical protein
MSDEEDDIILSELDDDELVAADVRRPLRRSEGRDRGRREHPAGTRLDALRHPDQGAGRRHDHRRQRLPRRHPLRARGAAGRQRDEGRHGHPQAASGRNRRAAHGQDGDRHREGRHPRHRQEPRVDDDGRRGVRGGGPRHQQRGRGLSRGAGDRTARHPRHVRAADHDDALHEGRHRHDGRKGHSRRLHRAGGRRAAERGIRPAIGADAYCRDAAVAVETAKEFVARKHNQMAARA